MTENFLILIDELGKVKYWNLDDMQYAIEWRPEVQIKKIWPNLDGTRLVAVDAMGEAWVWFPVIDVKVKIEKFKTSSKQI